MSKRAHLEAEFEDLQDQVKRLKDFLRWSDTTYFPTVEALSKDGYVDISSLPTYEPLPKDIDFSDSSSDAWYVLNKKYKSSSGSREYESSWDAKAEVEDSISYIKKNALKPNATFGTKQSALETLRKIGKSIVLAPSTLGSEVRKQFQRDDCLEEAMLDVLASLQIDQRKQIALAEDAKGKFVDKVDELWKTAGGLCILTRMKEVWENLRAAIEVRADVIDLTELSDDGRGEKRDESEHENEDEEHDQNVNDSDGSSESGSDEIEEARL